MNEGGLEGWKMLKHVQANVEDGALALCNVNEEQVQVSVKVGETFTTKLATIEVDLQKTIDMILKQKNVIIASMLEENGHVIKHVEIDVNDIFYLNLQFITHPFSLIERMGKFFLGKFVFAIPSFIVVFKLLPHLPSLCEKVGGAFFFGLNL